MVDEDYRFLSVLAKEEREDVSKKVRELIDPGRVMLALKEYKKSEASIGRVARIAGVSVREWVLEDWGYSRTSTFYDITPATIFN
jgi:hypothetical protein